MHTPQEIAHGQCEHSNRVDCALDVVKNSIHQFYTSGSDLQSSEASQVLTSPRHVETLVSRSRCVEINARVEIEKIPQRREKVDSYLMKEASRAYNNIPQSRLLTSSRQPTVCIPIPSSTPTTRIYRIPCRAHPSTTHDWSVLREWLHTTSRHVCPQPFKTDSNWPAVDGTAAFFTSALLLLYEANDLSSRRLREFHCTAPIRTATNLAHNIIAGNPRILLYGLTAEGSRVPCFVVLEL